MRKAIEHLLDFSARRNAVNEIDLGGLLHRIEGGDVAGGVDALVCLLCRHRTQTNTDEWRQFIAEEARVHPIKDLLHSDPFTRHAFTKPRGYPGDAELLDYMYAPLTTASDNSLAARISVYTTNAQAPEAVRDRRDAIARLIDATADEMKRKPRVLSLACGHLREAGMTTALRAGKVAELVALDQDEAALEVIQRDYGHMAVKTQLGSVKQILVRGLNDWGFDLIYAAGLFDYLSQPVGRRLCDVLFAALNPGGQLLVPNFMPGIRDVGYMEAFMDWFLIYRTEAQVRELIAGIPNFELSGLSSWTDERKNVVYLLACKRGLLQAR